MASSFVPALLASQLKATPVAGAPGAEKLITLPVLSLKVITPSLVVVAEIRGQLDVALDVQTAVSKVPVAVGSLLPKLMLGVAGVLGGKVSNSKYAVSDFPLVSVIPKMICHSAFGGNVVLPVPAGSSVCTFITNVRELSVQLVKGSPIAML